MWIWNIVTFYRPAIMTSITRLEKGPLCAKSLPRIETSHTLMLFFIWKKKLATQKFFEPQYGATLSTGSIRKSVTAKMFQPSANVDSKHQSSGIWTQRSLFCSLCWVLLERWDGACQRQLEGIGGGKKEIIMDHEDGSQDFDWKKIFLIKKQEDVSPLITAASCLTAKWSDIRPWIEGMCSTAMTEKKKYKKELFFINSNSSVLDVFYMAWKGDLLVKKFNENKKFNFTNTGHTPVSHRLTVKIPAKQRRRKTL